MHGGESSQQIIRELLDDLAEFEETPENVGYNLRLDLMDIVLQELHAKGMSKKSLAELTGMHPSFISRVVRADQNCTFEVAGRILHALGFDGQLRKVERQPAVTAASSLDIRYQEVQTNGTIRFESFKPPEEGEVAEELARWADARQLCCTT